MMMVPDTTMMAAADFWLFGALATLLVAVSKAGFGGAMGSLSLPLMLVVLPPGPALAVMLPVFLLADIYVGWRYRKQAVRRYVIMMVIAASIGQGVGWLVFKQISESVLVLLIGLLAVYTASRYFIQLARPPLPPETSRAALKVVRAKAGPRAALWGSVSGLASFISLTGGIPAQVYLLAMRLPRAYFVGTMGWFFLSINLAKLPFFIELGLFTPASITASLALAPLVPLGVVLGIALNKRLSDIWFYHISQAGLLLFGGQLVLKALF